MTRAVMRSLAALLITGCSSLSGLVSTEPDAAPDARSEAGHARDSSLPDAVTKDVHAHVDAGVDAPHAMDAGTDARDASASSDAPDSGFLLSIAPTHVTEDPGDSFPVSVRLDRAAGFSDAISVVVNGLPTGVTASPLVIPAGSSTGTFSLGIHTGVTVTNADVALTVVASNGGAFSQSTPLGLRFGSELLLSDGGVYVVPSYASTLIVKAWGAGGGGGGINGGVGGGGGFVSASVPVVPGESLTPVVGGAGTDNVGGGGSGGGVTGLQRAGTYLIIAGAGGGGGWSFNYPPQSPDRNGGGGGGTTGQTAPDPDNGGGVGGTQTMGGAGGSPEAGAGSSLQGGNAASPDEPGGVPGGGFGGVDESDSTGGGGGGGGYFGGGAGAESPNFQGTAGGGGGSGYVQPGATSSVLTAAIDSNCANDSDPDYVAGVGVGGPPGPGSKPNGGPGLIVIRLPKP